MAQPQQTDSQSTGLVIQALLAMGLSPTSPTFTGSGHSPVTAFLSFVVTSGSDTGALGYQDNTSGNLLATNQDVPILAGLIYGFGPTNSYWVATSTGAIHPFGSAKTYGSLAGTVLNQPDRRHGGDTERTAATGWWPLTAGSSVTATPGSSAPAAASPSTSPSSAWRPRPTVGGYWLVASDGGIFSYGDAGFFGSRGGQPLNKPIVGMAATADGGGYWLVASDGGIFSYGDAGFFGSRGGQPLNKPIVGMAATPDGGGYWLVASDGGIFNYGDAAFEGSTGSIALEQADRGHRCDPGWRRLLAHRRRRWHLQLRRRPLLRVRRFARHQQCGGGNGQRLVGCAAWDAGPECSRGVSSWARPRAVLAPAGPGALVPLKMAIASADSVGNDVYVAVVVDFGSGSSMSSISKCVPVASTAHDADALAAAVGEDNVAYNNSGLLCAIDNYPANGVQNCGQSVGSGDYDYWSYWHGASGSWVYANNGPSEQSVSSPADDVEGWRFQTNEPDNPSDPPPEASPSYAQICNASTEVPPGQTPPPAVTTTTSAPPSAAPTSTTTGGLNLGVQPGHHEHAEHAAQAGRHLHNFGSEQYHHLHHRAPRTPGVWAANGSERSGSSGKHPTALAVSVFPPMAAMAPAAALLPVALVAASSQPWVALALFRWRRRPADE